MIVEANAIRRHPDGREELVAIGTEASADGFCCHLRGAAMDGRIEILGQIENLRSV
jgi:hypothetical protein